MKDRREYKMSVLGTHQTTFFLTFNYVYYVKKTTFFLLLTTCTTVQKITFLLKNIVYYEHLGYIFQNVV